MSEKKPEAAKGSYPAHLAKSILKDITKKLPK